MDTPMSRRATAAWWIAFFLGGLFLVAHFAAIELTNMPSNPLTFQVGEVAQRYVTPLFVQNWSFFAPKPIARDNVLAVRGRTVGGRVTGWVDVSDPLVALERHNRFSPSTVIQLGVSNAVLWYVNNASRDPYAYTVRERKRLWRPSLPTTIDPADLLVMTRSATAALRAAYPNTVLRQVQLGLILLTFPRFTHRSEPDLAGSRVFLRIDWQVAPSVVPMCCGLQE